MQNFSSLGPVVFEIQPVLCSFFTTFLLVGVRKRPPAPRPFELSTSNQAYNLPRSILVVVELVPDQYSLWFRSLLVTHIQTDRRTLSFYIYIDDIPDISMKIRLYRRFSSRRPCLHESFTRLRHKFSSFIIILFYNSRVNK